MLGPGSYFRHGYGQAPYPNGVLHGYQESGLYQYGGVPQQVLSALPAAGQLLTCITQYAELLPCFLCCISNTIHGRRMMKSDTLRSRLSVK